MAAGRREDVDLTRDDVDRIGEALKDPEFRKLLVEYCEEVQSPENRKKYQEEFVQLEKERGNIVTFLEPQPGYVVKTSSRGEMKTFINVCSNRNLDRPRLDGKRLSLPHALTPPRNVNDSSGRKCIVYDAIFHPDALKLSMKSQQLKKILTETACDAVQRSHSVSLDLTNIKYPKSTYKGFTMPSVTRRPDPDHEKRPPSLIDDLYPQKSFVQPQEYTVDCNLYTGTDYTVPVYKLKHTRHIDMKEFTYEKDAKLRAAIPTLLQLEVNLPLLSSTADVTLDVKDKTVKLVSEKPARYKLDLSLPYSVNDEAGSAKFDIDTRVLTVSLPVIEKMWSVREDSGVESDMNSPFASDEDNSSHNTEVSDAPGIEVISENEAYRTSTISEDDFLDSSLSYSVPPYLCNVFDNNIVFTLQTKNVDPDSIVYKNDNGIVKLKFASIGAGYFTIYHALFLKFPCEVERAEPSAEAWDNNVVMQVTVDSAIPIDRCLVGLSENDMKTVTLETAIEPTKVSDVNEIRKRFDESLHISKDNKFLSSNFFYELPPFTLNTLDETVAFTFHVKKVDASSFSSRKLSSNDGIWLKFSSIETDEGFYHYSVYVKFPQKMDCGEPSLDVWENNTVVRLEFFEKLPDYILVGSSEFNVKKHTFDTLDHDIELELSKSTSIEPIVEIIAKGNNEINISLSQNDSSLENVKSIPLKRIEMYDNSICSSGGSFKGILKYKTPRISRSLSESSVDFVEYNMSPSYSLSSADCIPEESCSLKKTVRFSDIISKQTFRVNSSILGQKSKNQRKKRNKKRAQERRASEGDPDDLSPDTKDKDEDVFMKNDGILKHKDSGSMDTDDGDSDKCDLDKLNDNCQSIKSSKREFKNGKYQEINFKNDMIFDLDM